MFEAQSNLLMIVSIVLFVIKAFALVDCVTRRSSQFDYLETLSKQAWLIVLVLAVAAHVVFWYPLGILNLIGTVAALVYLAQVRGSVSR
jgi:hypothetical protein